MARGRPKNPLLNQADIVNEALSIAQAGREPTLGSIAGALGVHVSSLYNHIESKADLIQLLRERISTINPPATLAADDWAFSIRSIARRYREFFLAYPALLPTFASSPWDPVSGSASWSTLREILLSAGFTETTVEYTLDFVDMAALGSALALSDGGPASENEDAFQFGLDCFISGLSQLRGN